MPPFLSQPSSEANSWRALARLPVAEAAPPQIKAKRLVLVGAGALGSALAMALRTSAPPGLSDVLVIDPDRLEERNVSLSPLYREVLSQNGNEAFQQPKAALLAAALHRNDGGIRWSSLQAEFADVGWQHLQGADALVCSADDPLARLEVAYTARTLGVPWIDAAVFAGEALHGAEAQGRVSVFSPAAEAACPLCALQEERRAALLRFATDRSLGCQPLPPPQPLGDAAASPPVLETTAQAAVAALCALMDGSPLPPTSWVVRPAASVCRQPVRKHTLRRSATCPWHEPEAGRCISLLDGLPLSASVRELPADDHWRLQLPWPICLEARCLECQGRRHTPERLGSLRRSGRCDHCGSRGRLEALRVLRTLGPQSAELQCTPAELGLPSRHLLPWREPLPTFSQAGVQ